MSIFEKARFEIWNAIQHPYKHSLDDFAYSNAALPTASSITGALDYLFAVIYPNAKAAVATPAALPLVGNTLNDYRVVSDDGDGNSAGYRWEQREGEVSPSWHKVMDVDWSTDSILASFLDVTTPLYVVQNGKQDLDSSGNPIAGTFSGQTVYGGTQANQNLTLRANSGDGVGPHTGFVQVDDDFRPAADATYDIGTGTEQFKDIYLSQTAFIGTLTVAPASITDSSGAISFGNENLSTTGNIDGAIVTGTTSLRAVVGGETLQLVPGTITDTTGAISFADENLSTTGTLASDEHTITTTAETLILSGNNGSGAATITASLGEIDFGAADLTTTGGVSGGASDFSSLTIDSIFIDAGEITTTSGALALSATTVVDVQSAMQTIGITATGTVGVTGQLNVDNLRLDGNTITSTDTNGDIVFDPDGSGLLSVASRVVPATDDTHDLGDPASRFQDLYLSGNIGDGTTVISQATLQSLRDINTGVTTGDTIFWNGTEWVSSAPDTEVDHGTISGLADDDHTQYALLAGRAGGQTLVGGTAAGEDLVLESTANVTKGEVQTKDNLAPFTNASYSGSWSGIDIGTSSLYFRDLYTKGELKGARLENYLDASLPASSGQNVGRVVYATDTKKIYVDTGTAFQVAGVAKFVSDTSWDGIITLLNTDVSGSIQDARNAQWQLRDNANNFEIMYVTILATSASNVRITTNIPLPAGSYRLIGIE